MSEVPSEPEGTPAETVERPGGKDPSAGPTKRRHRPRRAELPPDIGAEVVPGELAEALKLPLAVVPKRPVLPILAMVRLHFGLELDIIASDTDLQIATTCPLPVSNLAAGAVLAVSAARLAAVAAAAGDLERMRLEPRPTGLLVQHDLERAVLALGEADQFPMLSRPQGEPVTVKLDADRLAVALGRVRPAIGHEETRFYLSGVNAQATRKHLELTATDGHRLHHVRLEADVDGVAELGERALIIPDRVLPVLMQAEGEIRLDLFPQGLVAACAAWHLTARTIDHTFPAWRDIVPPDRSGILVAADALVAAIDRVRGFLIGSKALVVALSAERIALQACGADRADVAETALEGDAAGDPGAMLATYNWRYLRDLAAIAGGEPMRIEWGSAPGHALRIQYPSRPDDVGVVMPMAGADWRELDE